MKGRQGSRWLGGRGGLEALTFLGLVLLLGCGEDATGLQAYIVVAEPVVGHAPLTVRLEVDFVGAEDAAAAADVRWRFGDGVELRGRRQVMHTYTEAGTYEVEVKVADGQREGRDRRSIRVLAPADLAIRGVEARPAQVSAGERLQVIFSLRSEAVAVEVPFVVEVGLIPEGAAVSREAIEVLHREVVDGLPGRGEAGAVQDVSREVRVDLSVATGNYRVVVWADPDEAIGEVDEANNVAVSEALVFVRNPRTDGPDLVAFDLQASPRQTRILSAVSLGFTLANEGASAVAAFEYAVFGGPAGDLAAARELMRVRVPGLAAGSSLPTVGLRVPIQPPIIETGDYDFWLLLDPDGVVVEQREDNNLVQSLNSVKVTDEAIVDADIVVTDFVVSPERIHLGGSLLGRVMVYNQGSQRTGSFICTVYFSRDQVLQEHQDIPMASLNVFDLGGDATTQVETIIGVPDFLATGSYWAFVLCDSSGVVVEFDEENNVQRHRRPIEVVTNAAVDLRVGAITISPSGPYQDGARVEVTALLCNDGLTGSGPVSWRILLSEDAQVTPGDRVLYEGISPALDAGHCEEVVQEVVVRCADWRGDYQLLVLLDARGQVQEEDKGNNVGVAPGGVRLEGPYCGCEADAGEPNDSPFAAHPVSSGQSAWTLCAGDVDWYAVDVGEQHSLWVHLHHLHGLGPLELLLYDESMHLLDRAAGVDGLQVSTLVVPQAGVLRLAVQPGAAGAINRYTLDVEVVAPRPGVVDLALAALEAEVQGLPGEALQVGVLLANLGEVAVTAPFSVTLRLVHGEEASWEQVLTQVEIDGLGGLERRTLELSAVLPDFLESGAWRLLAEVDPEGRSDDVDRSNNSVAGLPFHVVLACWDRLEPNDSFAEARWIAAQALDPAPEPNAAGLVVCVDQPDFYRFRAESGTQVRVVVTREAGGGALDLVLLNAWGQVLATSRDHGDSEEVLWPVVVGAQDLVVEVRHFPLPFAPSETQYSLTVTMVPAASSLQCNDAFEPNDSPLVATPLVGALGVEAAVCPEQDVDVYSVWLAAGSQVRMGLETDAAYLRASLYSGGGAFLGTLFDPRVEFFEYTAPFGDDVYVHVFGAPGGGRSQRYGLWVEGLAGVDVAVASFGVVPSVVYAGEAVQFTVDLRQQGTEASGSFAIALGVRGPLPGGGTVVVAEGQMAAMPPGGAARWTGKVDLPVQWEAGLYEAVVRVDPQGVLADLNLGNNQAVVPMEVLAACAADVYEVPVDNDVPGRATPLPAGPVYGTICPGDVDWYVMEGEAGQVLWFDLLFSHADGDLDLFVYDGALDLLAEARSSSDNEALQVQLDTSGPVYILVRPFVFDVSNSYTLTVTVN